MIEIDPVAMTIGEDDSYVLFHDDGTECRWSGCSRRHSEDKEGPFWSPQERVADRWGSSLASGGRVESGKFYPQDKRETRVGR